MTIDNYQLQHASIMNTPLDRAIAAAGTIQGGLTGIAIIAAACGTSRQFIHKMRRIWRDTGAPPRAMREHAPAIELACGGTVRADELCPDVTWERDGAGVIVRYSVPVERVA